ncbi:ABC transporter permease [Lysinibacillus mangiferihumi]|uniref:ABC transporter permease n=1 Tax=Lysinibacillus mangiferihumi TaxID=1130819 RepID=A0A4U2XZF1_9BACI|nr:ABC transporter permease [Lysinibacillus mangiferihumi]TKI53367.1 ABC transporter permease [Lysinibacillus mangiferihumi]
MFFDFVKRNSRKTRKENGVYFASLIVSIVAFYVILSLGEQDVMLYLKTIESDAVERLLLLIPVLYAVSLVFVFFLVYFANRYQLQQRSHEFGLYLMMGMKQSKLFLMIMGETIWNGIVAVCIGLPISLFLTELINLTTSRFVGMGIIGHAFRISWTGISLTICGFFLVQLLAMFILSFTMSRKEPIELLHEEKEKSQSTMTPKWGAVSLLSGAALLIGMILLCIAYGMAILYLRNFDYRVFALILLVGVCGTFILFRGLGSVIGVYVKRKGSSSTGLSMFTARQLQENVLHQWSSLAISTLLILMAMVCFAFGTSTALMNSAVANRTVDYTFHANNEDDIKPLIQSEELAPYVDSYYRMALHNFNPSEDEPLLNYHFAWTGLIETVSSQDDSEPKEILLNNLSMQDTPYFISLSSYNAMLEAAEKKPIQLAGNEVAMYTSDDTGASYDILKDILKKSPTVEIAENEYTLMPTLYSDQIVADRAITLMYSLIVPDALFEQYFDADETWLWNMTLKDEFIEEKGLMQAMLEVDQMLNSTGLQYESYLASMGRQLFYTVAGSYTTFYLGVMFLIIANTVLGLNFLMQQRSTRSRYQTLAMLGANVESICTSARKQIWLYFILAISVAFVSGIFGIWSLLTAMPATVFSFKNGIVIGLVVLLFIVMEIGYIRMIQRKSDVEIRKLKEID